MSRNSDLYSEDFYTWTQTTYPSRKPKTVPSIMTPVPRHVEKLCLLVDSRSCTRFPAPTKGKSERIPIHLLEVGICNWQAFLSRCLKDTIVSRSHNYRTKLRFLECKVKLYSGCDLDGIG